MKIKANISIFIILILVCSFSYQFEDFGFFRSLGQAKHNNTNNKTHEENNNKTIVISESKSENNTQNSSKQSDKENDVDENLNDKTKHFLKKPKRNNTEKNEIYQGDNFEHHTETFIKMKYKIYEGNNTNSSDGVSGDTFEGKITFNSKMSPEEREKMCDKLNNIISNLTDFDIKVSQLRSDFMNYTKNFINHHFTGESNQSKEEFSKDKDDQLVEYSEKMNDLNSLLQRYKLELYLIKEKEKCPNKSRNIIDDIETNFLNLVTLLKDQIRDSKIPLSFIMINLEENDGNEKIRKKNTENLRKEIEK